ncbi:MAG: T9SS type A sorting domain-containing protein [Ignavibacteria bacterium]|nr:T9SS type A sorting domain-containing protein [Ignavibacteria bacterium]
MNVMICFTLFVIIQLNILAQNPVWKVYQGNIPGTSIYLGAHLVIHSDNNGDKWIDYMSGFQGALLKFDDYLWTEFNANNSNYPEALCTAIVSDSDNVLWIGTGGAGIGGGLIKFDMNDFTIYDTPEFTLFNDRISSIATEDGDIWVGTDGNGLFKFDGVNWTRHDILNSCLSVNCISAIAIDNDGNKWIGNYDDYGWRGGLVMLNDSMCTVYNKTNSGLLSNRVTAIVIDDLGNKWIGSSPEGGGLAKFDGINWTVYTPSNSGLPTANLLCLEIESNGNIWIGTYGYGLVKFDGSNWTIFNTYNSDIPGNTVNSISIDRFGNKWIATYSGIGVYREDGVILKSENDNSLPTNFTLNNNYPNPFNPSTIIKYSIVEQSRVKINVYNLLGEMVLELVNTEQTAGYYEINFNANNLPSGVYFYSIFAEPVKGGNVFRDVKKMLLIK